MLALAAALVLRAYLAAPSRRRAAAVGVVLGLAQLTKFTLLLLYPLWLLFWLAATLRAGPDDSDRARDEWWLLADMSAAGALLAAMHASVSAAHSNARIVPRSTTGAATEHLNAVALVTELDAFVLVAIVDRDLEARVYRPGDPTTATPFGAREPADGRRLDPAQLDVIVTPAVAFDRTGRRVGYGGGYYDRFLPRTRPDALRVGIGSSVQLLDEDLPAGAFDLRVNAIVTPDETVRCSR